MDLLLTINRVLGLIMGVFMIYFCTRILASLRERELAISMIFLRSRAAMVFFLLIFISSIFTVAVALTFATGQGEVTVEALLNINALFLLTALLTLSYILGGDSK